MSSPMVKQGPPYPPTTWPLGGPPIKGVDVPVQSAFFFLFLVGAAIHMSIFQKNKARGHKFLPSLFIFGFCMARNVTSILRIASVCLPHNLRLAIAAQIFVAAGVLILFIINLIFTMRLVRSTHPSVGWHPIFSMAFVVICVIIAGTLVIVIVGTVQSFYTLDTNTRSLDRDFQLYGTTFFAIIATLPLPITLLSLVVRHPPHERFGAGRLRTKVTVLLVSTTLLSLGAWYRCGALWHSPVPRSHPLPGFLSKAPFYVFNFLVEIITVYMYAIARVDLQWHIPNGAKGPGSYSGSQQYDPSHQSLSTTRIILPIRLQIAQFSSSQNRRRLAVPREQRWVETRAAPNPPNT
ncbi:uncharacterized protein K460DRAFT_377772 [Cucurbitaria berberidis CBS 394.84]|uniref:Uncharacterized protein n=1 Tax=Cucurbitaria berberidis CBS 394.84 TaxID=1168544 RepID=A0A9P4GJ63_9PLEO|nr:uncharacterized protein K460DRAFT_377772 [Cucurbitaria berberidis CBS 394.84]KAF1846617.1 hypothetical protein K460DRAFT_377772 [Cucurbitaria berberidis CBS 394.84]